MMKKLMFLAMVMTVIAATASAAVCTISTTAPVVDGDDVANLAPQTGTLKWFHDIEHDAGQTFTPTANGLLNAFTIQLGQSNEDDGPDRLNLRLGTIDRPGGVFTFTDIYAENDVMLGADQAAGDYLTFTLDNPQALTAGVEYGVILDAQAFGNWTVGIPYLSETGAIYDGGNSIGRGGARNNDLVFHADIVPEPATIALLGLGGFFLRRKK